MRDGRVQQRMRRHQRLIVLDVAPAYERAEPTAVIAEGNTTEPGQPPQIDQQARGCQAEGENRQAAVLALPDAPWVRGALTGLQVAVVGLLAAALWRLARSEAGSALLLTVLLVAFAAGLFDNAALVVAAASAVGILIDRVKRDA